MIAETQEANDIEKGTSKSKEPRFDCLSGGPDNAQVS